MAVRRLDPTEDELLRRLRLRSLADAPTAFGSTLEQEEALEPEDWARRLDPTTRVAYVAEGPDAEPVGVVVGLAAEGDPGGVDLVGMWVDPSVRGTGAADELVAAVVGWASARGAAWVRLHVMDGNDRARRLYERHGFTASGRRFVRERDGWGGEEMRRPTAGDPALR